MANGKYRAIADKDAEAVKDECLKISFKFLDWSIEEFFLHGLEPTFYRDLFSCIEEISKSKESEVTQQTHPSLKPKSIFNRTGFQKSFPDAVCDLLAQELFVESRNKADSQSQAREMTSRAFELCIRKNSGRLHGFIWNNTFNLVWFDPAHNLYSGSYGIRDQKQYATVRCFSSDAVNELKESLDTVQKDYDEVYELYVNS